MDRVIHDVRPAAAFLRQKAPTQTHENRRNFQAAADLLDGLKMPDPDGLLVISIPVKDENDQVGWAEVEISVSFHGEPEIRAEFKPLEAPDN